MFKFIFHTLMDLVLDIPIVGFAVGLLSRIIRF